FGNPPAAKLGRASVVRMLERAAQARRERLELARSLGERTRQPPRDRVDDDHRRQVPVREDVGTDGDRVVAQVLDDAIVEAFEPGRQQRELLLARKLLDDLLAELSSLRGER